VLSEFDEEGLCGLSMPISIYKPNQGTYARAAAAGALLLLDLLACVSFYGMLGGEEKFKAVEIPVPYDAVWAGILFVALAAVIAIFVFGVQTGLRRLDAASSSLVDLLVDTQGELQKVSWPSREELSRSTVIVLSCVLLLGGFLWVVDIVISSAMMVLNVLPR